MLMASRSDSNPAQGIRDLYPARIGSAYARARARPADEASRGD